jgi:hypothetical protein
MGCGAGIHEPPETYEIPGKYATAIVDDRSISINVGEKQVLQRIEVKKYRDAFSTTLLKLKQEVALLDGIRPELFSGDHIRIPYKIADSIENSDDLDSGIETHVLVYPAGENAPERFVIGYADSPKRRCRVRHDDPGRTSILDHSPKKMSKIERRDESMNRGAAANPFYLEARMRLRKQRTMAESEAAMDWQTLEHRVTH